MPPSTANDTILTDDYVAQLLSKEADDRSLKYSSLGLDAYKSQGRPARQPKPNTRFLNSIIRDTNSHNRALLAKENAESQAKLKTLDRPSPDRPARSSPSNTRSRMLGDIAAILGAPKSSTSRRQSSAASRDIHLSSKEKGKSRGDEAGGTSDRDRHTHGEEHRSSRRHRHRDRDREPDRRLRDDHSRSRHHHRAHGHDRQHDSSRDRDRHRDRHHNNGRHHGRLSSDTRRNRSTSPVQPSLDYRQRSPGASRADLSEEAARPRPTKRAAQASGSAPGDPGSSSDSDPLDEIIGPAPPAPAAVRRRGRGATSHSGIDSRFASDYDPKLDISPGPDDLSGTTAGDDWDGAVEAFRDRQKWKHQGADRLRAAGFTEDQIAKWEKGDRKDESDVRWNRQGGTREWDRGKIMQEDGHVSHQAEWGRLKGT